VYHYSVLCDIIIFDLFLNGCCYCLYYMSECLYYSDVCTMYVSILYDDVLYYRGKVIKERGLSLGVLLVLSPYFMVDFSGLISGKIGCFRWRFL
jgi:hypothetical protein